MSDVIDLPSRREEAWRWADLDALRAAAAEPVGQERIVPTDMFLKGAEGARLLFVDGVYDAQRSRPGAVMVEPLPLETSHALGARAAGKPGFRLSVPRDGAESLVQIVHFSTGGENHTPALIELADDAVASLYEVFVGVTGWSNALSQVRLGRAARLMRAILLFQADGFVSIRDEAVLGEGASYVATVLGVGGMGSRYDAAVTLDGEGAFAEIGGALLTRGVQHQECAVSVRHAQPLGTSRQVWRAVAADRGQASLAARVEVARDAQKTDGEQSLRGLLLDRTATVNLKPELEIFADDVKCAHGATVGELDKRALFYLESRGIAPERAKALLTRAFLHEAIARIADDHVRDTFEHWSEWWLEKHL